MNLVWHGRSTMFESVPCQKHVAWQTLLNLNACQTNLKKCDSNIVCFWHAFVKPSSAQQKHNVWTGPDRLSVAIPLHCENWDKYDFSLWIIIIIIIYYWFTLFISKYEKRYRRNIFKYFMFLPYWSWYKKTRNQFSLFLG